MKQSIQRSRRCKASCINCLALKPFNWKLILCTPHLRAPFSSPRYLSLREEIAVEAPHLQITSNWMEFGPSAAGDDVLVGFARPLVHCWNKDGFVGEWVLLSEIPTSDV